MTKEIFNKNDEGIDIDDIDNDDKTLIMMK